MSTLHYQGQSVAVFDCHVHTDKAALDSGELCRRSRESSVKNLIVMSIAPSCFSIWKDRPYSNEERLELVLRQCEDMPMLHPVYWIDPTEEDAPRQVELAAAAGVVGFKVICGNHYPGDPRAMKTYERMAQVHKSVLFHSGILWDGKSSSRYNRPSEFEDLLPIAGLTFALAHISWPWTDECIAVFGKYEDARRHYGDACARMYVDITPGTPPLYRKEALYRLFKTGYQVEDSILFGSDSFLDRYDAAAVEKQVSVDLAHFADMELPFRVVDKVFQGNVKNFYRIR